MGGKFLTPVSFDKKVLKFGTADFETVSYDNKLYPICFGIFYLNCYSYFKIDGTDVVSRKNLTC